MLRCREWWGDTGSGTGRGSGRLTHPPGNSVTGAFQFLVSSSLFRICSLTLAQGKQSFVSVCSQMHYINSIRGLCLPLGAEGGVGVQLDKFEPLGVTL